MAWFFGDRRGPQWKQRWSIRALESFSLPPPPLIAVFAIVLLFLSMSSHATYRVRMERAETGLRLLLLFVPLLLFFAAKWVLADGRLAYRRVQAIQRAGGTPWRVVALVALLLLLVSYQSSFHSSWFRPLWRRH